MAITLYMLAEIVRSLFAGRGDPSKLNCVAEHLCRVGTLNPFQESYLLWRANNPFRENQNKS